MSAPAWACASCSGENPAGTKFCGHCGAPAGPAPPAERQAADVLRSFVSTQIADRLAESGGRLTEERRLVTSLFADLSGFTPLADRLDPEQLLEVIDPLITMLTNVVGRYEGYVDKFAGDALLAFFGAPTAHEDDAERALRVALDMHRELAEALPRMPPDVGHLTLHIGVNSGHAVARVMGSEVRMDYAVLGDAVILAQRLESAAPAGETYVGETTWRLTRHRFDFEPVGELTLKGKREPVPAWRLVGERRAGSRAAGALAVAPAFLVGRDRELVVVDRLMTRTAAGARAMAAVLGDAGVGKSALAGAARARAEAAGVRWTEGRCLSYGAALPFRPYVEWLRDLAGAGPDEAPDAVLGRLGVAGGPHEPFLARLLGGSSPATDALEPEALQRGAFAAVVALALRLAEEQPTVVAVEDVHWMDASSHALTIELARVSTGRPLSLWLAGRPESRPLVEEAAERAGESVTVMELAPLDAEATRALVAAVAGRAVGPRLEAAVVDRTGGNPFFVEELVRSLAEAAALDDDDPAAVDRLPATIEGVLAARIDRLPRPAAAAMQVAAVIGRRVLAPLLRAVTPDGGDLERSLTTLVAAGFLDRDPDDPDLLVFHHALAQEVAYSRMLRRQRRDLHLAVADAAERLYGAGDDSIALLARHLYLAEAGERALAALERAAAVARRLYANDEAVVHLRRAVEVAEAHGADRLPDLLLDLGDVLDLVGAYDEALAVYDRARQAGGAARAWQGMAAVHRRRGRYDEALAVLDEAGATASGDRTGLVLERARALAWASRYGEAAAVCRAALAEMRPEGSVAGHLLVTLAQALLFTDRREEALVHGEAARQRFEAEDDARGLAVAMRALSGIYLHLDRVDEAAASLRRGLALAEQVGNVEEISACLLNLGMIELRRGALDAAIACDRRAAEEFERVGHRLGRAMAYGNLAEKLLEAGSDAEADDYSTRARRLGRDLGDHLVVADATVTAARLRLRAGDPEGAAALAEEAAATFEEGGAAVRAAEAMALAAEARAAAVADP